MPLSQRLEIRDISPVYPSNLFDFDTAQTDFVTAWLYEVYL